MSYLQLRLRDQAEAAEQRPLLVSDVQLGAGEDQPLVLDGHAGDGLEAGLELGDGPVRRDAALRGGVDGDDAQGDGGHGGRKRAESRGVVMFDVRRASPGWRVGMAVGWWRELRVGW